MGIVRLVASPKESEMRYDQLFYVGVNNPRFRGISSSGHLPALELEEVSEDKPEPQWNKRQWGIIDQLRNEQKNIRNLIYKTLKENKAKYASKRKTNYTIE